MDNPVRKSYFDLINIWRDIFDTPPFICLNDLMRTDRDRINKQSNFRFDFIPQPFWGNILTPKVIILTLNPGYYSERDYQTNELYKQEFIDNLSQRPSLNWFNLKDTKDYRWWHNAIKDLLDENITEKDIYEKVGFFEFIGYHSKSFPSKLYNSYIDLNIEEFGAIKGILPSQKALFKHIDNLLNQEENERPLVAIIWGQKFWLQGIPTLKDIDYIDTISTTSHQLSIGNLRPMDFNRLKQKLSQ